MSAECVLDRSEVGLVGLRFNELGFIEIRLGDDWNFEYADPNVLRTPHAERVSPGHSSRRVKYGSCVVGANTQKEYATFTEVEEGL